MLIFMGFGCILQHLASRFGAYCIAFWCILHCKSKHYGQHFFVVSDANLAQIFFKEKCKSIVNGKKWRGEAP